MNKKCKQLEENYSTASNKLRKLILFHLVKRLNYKCFRCKKKLYVYDFTIDHKIPWLNSKNPKKLFFSIDNIAFSHAKCNYSHARKPNKKWKDKKSMWKHEYYRKKAMGKQIRGPRK